MASGDAAREYSAAREARKRAREEKLRLIRDTTVADTLLTGRELLEEQRRLRAEMYERMEKRGMTPEQHIQQLAWVRSSLIEDERRDHHRDVYRRREVVPGAALAGAVARVALHAGGFTPKETRT